MRSAGFGAVFANVEDFAAFFLVFVQSVTVCVLPQSFEEFLHVADYERAVFVSFALVVVVQRMLEASV